MPTWLEFKKIHSDKTLDENAVNYSYTLITKRRSIDITRLHASITLKDIIRNCAQYQAM